MAQNISFLIKISYVYAKYVISTLYMHVPCYLCSFHVHSMLFMFIPRIAPPSFHVFFVVSMKMSVTDNNMESFFY